MATPIIQQIQPQSDVSNLRVNPNLFSEDADRDGFYNMGSGSNTYTNTWWTDPRLVNGQGGDDHITTGAGNDQVYGGSGNDVISTGAGNDKLFGGSGDDVLVSGAGSDEMTGGSGKDMFSVGRDGGVDTIFDFVRGEDHLRLGFGMSWDLDLPRHQGAGGTEFVVGQNLIVGDHPTSTLAQATMLFNSTTGMLSYDADGTGAAAAVDMVRLVGVTTLSDADFYAIYPA